MGYRYRRHGNVICDILKPSAFKQTPDDGGSARGGMGDEGDREHRGDSHLSIQEGNYT